MGKSTPQTTQSTQSVNMGPWGPQQPYLTKAFSEAERLYNTHNPSYFPDSTVAGANPNMTAGWDQAAARATQGSPLVPAAQGMTLDTINGKYLDPSSNPFLAATYGKAAGDVTRNFMTATQPSTAATFAGAGRYGSGARALQTDLNNRAFGDTLNNLATSIYGGNYQQERDRQVGAASAAPGMVQAGYIEPSILAGVGKEQQGQTQQEINDRIARWNFEQQLPYNKLQTYLGQVQGNYGQSGTMSTQQTQNVYSNPAAQGIGALLSLASAAGGLGWKPFG